MKKINLFGPLFSPVFNLKTLMAISIFFFSFILFSSCAKKDGPLRAIKQTESNVMNPITSTPSVRAADAQNLLYDIVSISWPIAGSSAGSFDLSINSEIKTPDGRYIPVTTSHQNNRDSVGVIDDTEKNGTKIDVRARCEGANCEKYLMLATVVKGGYAVYQLAVVSYSTDCKFNLENLNPSVQGLRIYSSLDDLSQRNTVKAQNDCPVQ